MGCGASKENLWSLPKFALRCSFVIIISFLSSLALLRLGKPDQPQCHKGASAAKALITGTMVVFRDSFKSWPEDKVVLGKNRHTSFLTAVTGWLMREWVGNEE